MKKILIALLIIAAVFFVYWSKTAVTQDNDAPSIVSTTPASGASGVPTNDSIHVYFSEPMDPSSITSDTFTVRSDMGSPIDGEVTYANRAAAFVPFEHMDDMSSYTATISGSVTDSSGNALGSSYSWSFQTAAE